jgi:hypothetical protein
MALQRKGMEIASVLPIAAAQVCFLSYWLMDFIWAFPAAFQPPFRMAQRLANSLWAFLSSFPISFQKCPVAVHSLKEHLPVAIGKN